MRKKDPPGKRRPIPLRLKEMRERYGWSQAQLADLLETSDATINRIEKGKQNWSQEMLQNAAFVLQCQWRDLLPPEPGAPPSTDPLAGLDAADRRAVFALIDRLRGKRASA